MKNKILLLFVMLISTSVFASAPVIWINADAGVNAVIGDESFHALYHRQPSIYDDEVMRIQTHLAYVEQRLRQADAGHLTEAQLCRRLQMLDILHDYWQAGCFPQNFETPGRRPIFIDSEGTHCAVGQLIKESGYPQLAKQIDRDFHLSYVPDINTPALATWVDQAGLTVEECAMIQPAYMPVDPPRRVRANNWNLFSLELRRNHVETKIKGQSATTSMDQVFYNPTQHQLQGYFIFPIPQGASIDHFSMFINGKETQGELLSADKARKIYEDILRKMKDPALLEYYGNALFRVRIFPIQPRSEQRVKLTYTQSLKKENGTIEYIFPFKHASNLQKAVGEVSFKINIEGEDKLKTIYCPTHQVEINRKGDRNATIGFEGQNVASAHDFKLYYNTDRSKIGLSLLNYNDGTEDGYFFLNASPGFVKNNEIAEKDITFVLDCSGSMSGEKMEQAKKALGFCVNNLNGGDRFNIIRFSTEAEALFDQIAPAQKAQRAKAHKYIDQLRAIGGTNIDEALGLALRHRAENNRPHFVVFLTDGKPTIGETGTAALLKKVEGYNSENTRIFTFGIGHKLNTHLLDQLTQMTKAYRTYVNPEEDIEIKVSDFYTKVASPVLTNIKVEFSGKVKANQIYPKQIPDLFAGSTLSLFGRYQGNGKGKVIVSGQVNGKQEHFSYTVDFPAQAEENSFIPPLWGARAVSYLLDQIRLNGETAELKDEVVRIAKKHGIITPYTSYLIIEDEQQLIGMNRLRRENATLSNRVRPGSNAPKMRSQERFKDSGAESTIASEEIQELNQVDNLAIQSEAVDNVYEDAEGEPLDLASDIVHVHGRAIYLNQRQWTDSNVQLEQYSQLPTRRIQFNSTDYFELLKEEPESRNFLVLGRNVRFQLNNEIIEVYE